MSDDVKKDDSKNDGTAADVETTEAVEETEAADQSDETEATDQEPAAVSPKRTVQWKRVVAFGLLPALALILALGAGYLKYLGDTFEDGTVAVDPSPPLSPAEASIQAAKDSTIALLSYTPDKVEEQLGAARDLLTGEFRDSYTDLTNDVVIPGAKEKQISAVASVPAAASVSVSSDEAVVLLFVNQTVNVGQDPPTDTASSVRVTLEKVDGRWLISQFDPV
ncbi:hypothetical protein ACAG25_20270 [Mycobacterium sp. pV006]|uniref:hypothetical protein n=1 Tax=Mycobacterium sp. pV006 TaxID=3238983 RepID=UPI00351AF541